MLVLVDEVEQCKTAVKALMLEKEVAVDIEGFQLSRQGPIGLIQICGSGAAGTVGPENPRATARESDEASPTIYLFDIAILREDAFGYGMLKQLLQSPEILKVFFDVRADNDALFHQYQIKVQSAYDLQVLWHIRFHHNKDRYLEGLPKILEKFLNESQTLSPEEMSKITRLKEAGRRTFDEAPRVWMERPLSLELQEYAAADVKLLLPMKNFWTTGSAFSREEVNSQVKKLTMWRLEKFVAKPDHQSLDQSTKKFKDFDFDMDTAYNNMKCREVIVPRIRFGALVGEKGAVRREMERVTGARVSIPERNAPATEQVMIFSDDKGRINHAQALIEEELAKPRVRGFAHASKGWLSSSFDF